MGAETPIRITVQQAGAAVPIAIAAATGTSVLMKNNNSTEGSPSVDGDNSHHVGAVANDYNLSLVERMISASSGAILTSLLVTPFDVVKTRLQAGSQGRKVEVYEPAECPRCSKYILNNGLMEHQVPKASLSKVFNCDHRFAPHYRGTWDAMIKISRAEGVASLYNGLPPTLLMAVPATVLYFAAYDSLRSKLNDKGVDSQIWNPLLAGTLARTLATTSISPFELARTKMQSINNPPNMFRLGINQVQQEGFRSLWKGLSLTLWRDVPFSAVYWLVVETTKSKLKPPTNKFETFKNSFIAGATGGMIAATLTHPFDVVKTQLQMIYLRDQVPEHKTSSSSTVQSLRSIVNQRGVSGLFVGLTPRLTKVTAACAIMLSSYEFGKHYFSTQKQWGDDSESLPGAGGL